ncbi:MAG: hypothetical protein IKR04_00650 [Clostridia bacterium]|nr:hypothetical protein [Clostridia bacterium]
MKSKFLAFLVIILIMTCFTTVYAKGRVHGDLNGDGVFNIADIRLLIQSYVHDTGASLSAAEFEELDLNGDGLINVNDVRVSVQNYATDANSTFSDVDYDEEDYVLDLGENWEDYTYKVMPEYYLYGNSQGSVYVASQQFINYDFLEKYFYNRTYNTYFDKIAVRVMNSDNHQIYKDIEVPNPFSGVYYNEYTYTLELGEDWDDYSYKVMPRFYGYHETQGTIYNASQSTLDYDDLRDWFYNQDTGLFYDSIAVRVMMEDNRSVYRDIRVNNPFAGVYYNEYAYTLELGEDWDDYSYKVMPRFYGYHETQGTLYRPSQSSVAYNMLSPYMGEYPIVAVRVMRSSDNDLFIDVPVRNVFKNVYYDENEYELCLGEDWDDYSFKVMPEFYAYGRTQGAIYEASQRTIDYEYLDEYFYNSQARSYFDRIAVRVMLTNNKSVYKDVEVENPFYGVEYDKEDYTLDFGADWNDYSFKVMKNYFYNSSQGTIYRTTQRTLDYDYLGAYMETESMKNDRERIAVRVYMRANENVYRDVTVTNPFYTYDYYRREGSLYFSARKNYPSVVGMSYSIDNGGWKDAESVEDDDYNKFAVDISGYSTEEEHVIRYEYIDRNGIISRTFSYKF